MKCLFPKLTSIQQKFVCVGAGVLFTTSTVGGLYYSHMFIGQSRVVKIQKYIIDKVDNGCDVVFNGFEKVIQKTPSLSPTSEKTLENLAKPILKYVISPSLYIFFSACSFIGMSSPVFALSYMYTDIIKFKNMLKNTDQCCIIIRNAGIKTVTYPVVLGLGIGMVYPSYIVFDSLVIDGIRFLGMSCCNNK